MSRTFLLAECRNLDKRSGGGRTWRTHTHLVTLISRTVRLLEERHLRPPTTGRRSEIIQLSGRFPKCQQGGGGGGDDGVHTPNDVSSSPKHHGLVYHLQTPGALSTLLARSAGKGIKTMFIFLVH